MRSRRVEIRIRGRLCGEPLARFDGFEVQIQPVETVLRGVIEDQAALHGLLEKINAFGLELVAARPIGERRENPQG
jgi:hypothetical protein